MRLENRMEWRWRWRWCCQLREFPHQEYACRRVFPLCLVSTSEVAAKKYAENLLQFLCQEEDIREGALGGEPHEAHATRPHDSSWTHGWDPHGHLVALLAAPYLDRLNFLGFFRVLENRRLFGGLFPSFLDVWCFLSRSCKTCKKNKSRKYPRALQREV